MKAVGIIVEYNPFHNGHTYHVEQARQRSHADVVIAIMSGHFLQRGEPALVNKWARTEMALAAGIDIVIELPYTFATQKAEIFANGGVSLLHALDVDYLCFGSEEGDILPFYELVSFYEANKHKFDELIKAEIKKGISYPKATAHAFHHLRNEPLLDLSLPNNILGFHYVKAIKEQKAPIQPFTIARTKANYHDTSPRDAFIASATSIRHQIDKTNQLQAIEAYVPNTTLSVLQSELKKRGQFMNWEKLFPFLKYKLLTSSLDELQMIYEMEEGIESRLVSLVKDSTSFEHFLQRVKTKRFTWTRLQRILTHVVTNTKKPLMLEAHNKRKANYIRLLGMSPTGQDYLNKVKKQLQIPIISKYSKRYEQLLKTDIQATYTYASGFPGPVREQLMKMEYTMHPIIYDFGGNERK